MDDTMTHEYNELLPTSNKDDLYMDVLPEPSSASTDEEDNKAMVSAVLHKFLHISNVIFQSFFS